MQRNSLPVQRGRRLLDRVARRQGRDLDHDALDDTGERERWLVIIAHREAAVATNQQAGTADLPTQGHALRQRSFGYDDTVDGKTHHAVLPSPIVLDDDRVSASAHRIGRRIAEELAEDVEG